MPPVRWDVRGAGWAPNDGDRGGGSGRGLGREPGRVSAAAAPGVWHRVGASILSSPLLILPFHLIRVCVRETRVRAAAAASALADAVAGPLGTACRGAVAASGCVFRRRQAIDEEGGVCLPSVPLPQLLPVASFTPSSPTTSKRSHHCSPSSSPVRQIWLP